MLNRDNDYQLLTPRQQAQADDTAELATEFGMFDQTSGADGAHYAPAKVNPFKADGLMCQNCVFFNEDNSQCQVVAGPIEAEAICKLWVIPESYLVQRSSMDELETRDLHEVRVDHEARTITGIAVPYGETANIGGAYKERFAPGAISDVTNTKLFYGHSEPIGKVVEGRDTKQGYEITARVSDTPRGNEVLTLMRDGVLNKFSVGFVPVTSERDGDTIVRTSVNLAEVSVVAFPAYSGASISEVREESEPQVEKEITRMSDVSFDIAAVRDEVAELRRSVEAAAFVAPTANTPQYRSFGEFVKAYALGEDAALEFATQQRAATTSADAALRPAFLGTVDALIAANRTTANLFVTAALPATGLSVEWAKVTTNTIATGKQTTENTALTDGNIVFSTLSSPVATYGSQTSMSRQTIERSTVPFLDTAFRAMAIGYAKKTNTDVIATLAGLTFTSGNGRLIDISTSVTPATVAGAIADGASYIYQNAGVTPEFLLMDTLAYKKFVTLVDGASRPMIQSVVDGQGVNNIGNANIPTLRGSMFNLPIYVDPGLAANTVYLGNSNAVVSYESSGTPTRLQLEDPGTLTNKYAIYGYGVFSTVPFDAALVKIKVA